MFNGQWHTIKILRYASADCHRYFQTEDESHGSGHSRFLGFLAALERLARLGCFLRFVFITALLALFQL
jgi:hypothetical protein